MQQGFIRTILGEAKEFRCPSVRDLVIKEEKKTRAKLRFARQPEVDQAYQYMGASSPVIPHWDTIMILTDQGTRHQL